MINFSIPKQLLKTVDTLAETEMKTRSELLRDAVRDYLERRVKLTRRWEAIFAFGKKRATALKINPNEVEKLVDDYREGN